MKYGIRLSSDITQKNIENISCEFKQLMEKGKVGGVLRLLEVHQ